MPVIMTSRRLQTAYAYVAGKLDEAIQWDLYFGEILSPRYPRFGEFITYAQHDGKGKPTDRMMTEAEVMEDARVNQESWRRAIKIYQYNVDQLLGEAKRRGIELTLSDNNKVVIPPFRERKRSALSVFEVDREEGNEWR